MSLVERERKNFDRNISTGNVNKYRGLKIYRSQIEGHITLYVDLKGKSIFDLDGGLYNGSPRSPRSPGSPRLARSNYVQTSGAINARNNNAYLNLEEKFTALINKALDSADVDANFIDDVKVKIHRLPENQLKVHYALTFGHININEVRAILNDVITEISHFLNENLIGIGENIHFESYYSTAN